MSNEHSITVHTFIEGYAIPYTVCIHKNPKKPKK